MAGTIASTRRGVLVSAPAWSLRWTGVAVLALLLVGYVAVEAMHRADALLVDYDPAMQYLLDSLNFLRGLPYTYVDHPGTPVEILGTLFLLPQLAAVGGSVGRLSADTLAQPEQFLLIAEVFLLVASIGVVIALARWAVPGKSQSKALAALIVAGLYFAAHPMAPLTLTWWTHNAFGFIGETLLGLVVLSTVRAERAPGLSRSVWLGLACGVLAAVQIYFACATLGTAVAIGLALRQRRARWLSIVVRTSLVVESAAVGFVIATLPTEGYVVRFFEFIRNIAQHQGRYGEGAEGFTSADALSTNLADLVSHAPLLFVLLAVVSVGLIWQMVANRRRGRPLALYAAGPAFLLQTAMLLAAIAKHPGVVYLLSVAAMLPLLTAVWLDAEPFATVVSRRLLRAAAVLVSLAVLGNAAASTMAREATYANNRVSNDAVERAVAQVAAARGVPRSSLSVVWGYGTPNRCYALWFAAPTAGDMKADIAKLCGTAGELNIWTSQATPSRWDVAVVPGDLLNAYPRLRELGDDVDLGVPSTSFSNLHLLVAPTG